MLTVKEEVQVQKLLRDSAPMPVMNPNHGVDNTTSYDEGQYMARLMRNLKPLRVLAGNPLGPVDGRIPQQFLGEDESILKKISHVIRKGEKLMQFFSRVGLSLSQSRTMSKNEISRFVQQSEANAMAEPDKNFFEPRPLPNKITIVDSWQE